MCGKALKILRPQSKVCHCAVELMRHAVDPSVFGLANGEIYVEIAVFVLIFFNQVNNAVNHRLQILVGALGYGVSNGFNPFCYVGIPKNMGLLGSPSFRSNLNASNLPVSEKRSYTMGMVALLLISKRFFQKLPRETFPNNTAFLKSTSINVS